MPNLRELRSRIKSVESTSRVTNALQMIAAAKMKKAQDKVIDGRAYGQKLNSILSNFYLSNPEIFNSEETKGSKNLVVLVTPDRGLCGALVSNVLKSASNYFENSNSNNEIVVIGKKGNSFISVFLNSNLWAISREIYLSINYKKFFRLSIKKPRGWLEN